MEQPILSLRYAFRVDALTDAARSDRLKQLLTSLLADAPGGQKIEIDIRQRRLVILSSEPLEFSSVKSGLQPFGFHLHAESDAGPPAAMHATAASTPADASSASNAPSLGYARDRLPTHHAQQMTVRVEGMTCHSCELNIEHKWKRLDGVRRVEANTAKGIAVITHDGIPPTIERLREALGEQSQYTVGANGSTIIKKPSIPELIGLFALVLIIGKIMTSFGLFKTSFAVGSGMSLGAIFAVGLVAAASSCIAVAGGLLLSSATAYNERYGSAGPLGRMMPVGLFVGGRIAGYALFGGLLGVIGKALSPSPTVTAIIAIVAATYMIVMGLDMLRIAPKWLKRLMPKMPKSLAHRVIDAEGKTHPLAPVGLGAATFFLPCGFTQAFQLYALTTGSFATGALSLGIFALGTAPALLALGWASSSLKGKAGTFFFKFAGALVIVLGLWNIQNGLAIAGHPLSFPKFSAPTADAAQGPSADAGTGGGDLALQGGKQVIRMKVSSSGYSPDHFTVRAGVPVRWEVDGSQAGGCNGVLVSRALNIQKLLDHTSLNVFEFTPTSAGDIAFSCSMGMYRGSITVLPGTS
jgi:uncharacterized protein